VAVAASDQEAQQLIGKARLNVSGSGQSVTAEVEYPLDEYDDYYYPPEHSYGFGLSLNNDTVSYMGRRVHVSTGSLGSGINLHVDLLVKLPKGVKLTLDHKVGKVTGSGLASALDIHTSSADVRIEKHSGDISADTGSGDLEFSDTTGALDLHTGSGDVDLRHQKGGDIVFHTGSGDVKLTDAEGSVDGECGSGDVVIDTLKAGTVKLETGSGDIDLSQATARSLTLRSGSGDLTLSDVSGSLETHTGSGDLHATGFKAGDSLKFHSGSGEVRLSGDLGAVTSLEADTGSGDIHLRTSGIPSWHISATSHSGDVDVDLPNLQNVSTHEGSFRADVNGGKGTVDIESGSGDISVSH
ncbi:MAG TPA: DUF4097 family beta strand repeat-containing protein, partial [Gammaproteobacteria bacterium]|nr:DUF4097 family beta strand repeat-containing protein [Gammaproteobacteria bacterium]